MVWQESTNLVVDCYKLTSEFPINEAYGLSSQLQRSAVSIPSNIAEGRQRPHKRELIQHLSIADGSLAELETHLQIAGRLEYIDEDQLSEILNKKGNIGKMINGLRKSLG